MAHDERQPATAIRQALSVWILGGGVNLPVEFSTSLKRAVGRFGLGTLAATPEPVSQAWSNDVFRVHTAAGVYAIKLFPPKMSDDRLAALRAGMSFEAKVLDAGTIPIPRPVSVTGDSDEWLVELETPSGARLARCHEWVFGDQPAASLSSELVRAAGGYLGTLHAMNHAGGDTSQLAPVDITRWREAVRAAVEHEFDGASQLADLEPLVVRLATDLQTLREQDRPMRISHRDFDPKNTVIDRSGRLVVADWDYAGPVLPDAELTIAATSFANSEAGVREFVSAYYEAGGNAAVPDRLALTMEAADLDWLLRNVEACLNADPASSSEQAKTASDLISSLPDDVETLYSWPDRLAALGVQTNH